MVFAPDGRLFICQQNGQLRIIKDGAMLSQPFLTVATDSTLERGLLGVALDPAFATNRFIYIYYTALSSPRSNRVSRFLAGEETVVPGSEQVLLNLEELTDVPNHNGGALRFGSDGKLYVAVGDNARSFKSRDVNSVLGKILRLNPDGTIPEDNPFYETTQGINRSVWALGLRNPFTFAIQSGTGRIFINDVGETGWEEINEGFPGADFGWPTYEGPGESETSHSPLFAYGHGINPDEGCAITGGTFYNPASSTFPPEFIGKYFFADYCGGWIRVLDPENPDHSDGFATGLDQPVGLEVGLDGALYVLTRSSVFRIQATSTPGIVTQPIDQTVQPGAAGTFSVSGSGAEPLTYQWFRNGTNIPGATHYSYSVSNAQWEDSGNEFVVEVSNPHGSITSNPALLLVTTNSPPNVIIFAPRPNRLYRGGETIEFAGVAGQNGSALPRSAFTWTVVFHHGQHTHPFFGPIEGVKRGTFVIPTSGETASDVFYRIHLTAADATGMSASTSVDVKPRTSLISLETSPPGLRVTLGGQPLVTPVTVTGVVGIARSLGVISPQVVNGTNFGFLKWSDDGAAVHGIWTPATNTTYRASFIRETDLPPLSLSRAGQEMVLRWPAISTGYVVQATHTLKAAVPWKVVTNPVTIDEAWCGTTADLSTGNAFFRLAGTNALAPLSFSRTGTTLYLRWPVQATGGVLEVTPVLTPIVPWYEMTNPVDLIGEQYQLTIPLSNGQRFFRLMKP